jgi:hypothetical protein
LLQLCQPIEEESMIEHIRTLLLRDLEGLRRELELYPDDETLWATLPGFPNRGGTLALHLAGNLRHFVGAQLGGSGYIRRREEEFSRRGVSRRELVEEVDRTSRDVAAALDQLDPARLDEPFNLPTGQEVPTALFLMHLTGHLTFHLGQIDYHRRAITGDPTSAGVIPLAGLAGGGRKQEAPRGPEGS